MAYALVGSSRGSVRGPVGLARALVLGAGNLRLPSGPHLRSRKSRARAAGGDARSRPGHRSRQRTTPTWAALDARVDGIANELRTTRTIDDYQDVGRRCREVLIDAAKLIADPSLVPVGQSAPQAAKAKAWLDLFLASRADGRSHAGSFPSHGTSPRRSPTVASDASIPTPQRRPPCLSCVRSSNLLTTDRRPRDERQRDFREQGC